MDTTIIAGNLVVTGGINAGSVTAPIGRSSITVEGGTAFPIPLTSLRVWDAFQTNLPGTAAADDLALITGTFGTNLPYVATLDFKNTSTTAYARTMVQIPYNYESGQLIQIRAAAGMKTTIASSAPSIDFEAYKSNRDTTPNGGDFVATAAQTMNSLTFSNKTFDLNNGLVAGDWLDIRMKITGTDVATGTAVIAAVAHLELLCGTRG